MTDPHANLRKGEFVFKFNDLGPIELDRLNQEIIKKVKAQDDTRTPTDMVREFHQAFGLPVGKHFHPLVERLQLRLDLITEEYDEVEDAVQAGDWVNLLKELADLVYVAEGMALEMGVPLNEVISEVHRSNMSKLGEDGLPIYREDGKVLKGPNYSPADIESVVKRYAPPA